MNCVSIVGNLGKDPELRYTAAGNPVCDLSLAVNEVRNTGGGKEEKVNWFSVRVLGKTAEAVASFMSKGSAIGVTGRLTQDTWEKDGKKHSIVRIIAREVKFLTPRGSEEKGYSKVFTDDEPF